VEHIRAALAARGPHHLGLAVQADEEEVRLRGPIDSEAQRTDILAVVREGLTNVARHAQAGSAEVTVSRAGGEVSVEVRDDGRGIGSRDERRSGLANLADRASARRGSLQTGPVDGGGTRLLWRVPVPHR